jgi:hypothetical protein
MEGIAIEVESPKFSPERHALVHWCGDQTIGINHNYRSNSEAKLRITYPALPNLPKWRAACFSTRRDTQES